ITAVFLRKIPCGAYPVAFHLTDVGARKPCHLARMRRKRCGATHLFQDIYMRRKKIYTVRVDHGGHLGGGQQVGKHTVVSPSYATSDEQCACSAFGYGVDRRAQIYRLVKLYFKYVKRLFLGSYLYQPDPRA